MFFRKRITRKKRKEIIQEIDWSQNAMSKRIVKWQRMLYEYTKTIDEYNKMINPKNFEQIL